nr:MAG TPA: hypothetical protein [Caudoviricetes sp.]
MSGYLGVDNTARKVKELYVGVGNTARVVQKAYIGVGNVARLWYTRGPQLGGLAVGSSVYFKVNNVRTEWLVVQQGNPSTSIYDSSCDGTWLLMKNIYENRQWNNANINDYAGSTIHSYLNSTFLRLLEAGVRSAVKQVKIPYRKGRGASTTVTSGSNGLSAKIFLLSATEIGFKASSAPIGEGAELAYFDSQSKRVAERNGSAASWALRSPYCDGSTSVMFIHSSGRFNSIICYTSNGIRPCLILPKGTLLDDNNNVIGG